MMVEPFEDITLGPNEQYREYSKPLGYYGDRVALKHFRIYERVPVFPADPMEVLRDALLAYKREPEINEIIKETGIAGMWLPSTVIVMRLRDDARGIELAYRTIAHALWDIDFDCPLTGRSSDRFSLCLSNDEPRERQLRAYLILKPITTGPGTRRIRP